MANDVATVVLTGGVVPSDSSTITLSDGSVTATSDVITVEVSATAQGPRGAAGTNGVGVPAGGSNDAVLRKASGTDYDTEWDSLTDKVDVAGDIMTGALEIQADAGDALYVNVQSSVDRAVRIVNESGYGVNVLDNGNVEVNPEVDGVEVAATGSGFAFAVGSGSGPWTVDMDGNVDMEGYLDIDSSVDVVNVDLLGPAAKTTDFLQARLNGATESVVAGIRADGRVYGEYPTDGDDFTTVDYVEGRLTQEATHVHPADEITVTAAGNIASTDVQAALEELDDEKAGLALANIFTDDQAAEDAAGIFWTAGVSGETVPRISMGHYLTVPFLSFSDDGLTYSAVFAYYDEAMAIYTDQSLSTFRSIRVGEPGNAPDAATKNYVDTADALKLDLTGGTISGNLIVTGDFTVNNGVLINGTSDEVQLTVEAHSTQTANLQVWRNSSATVMAGIGGAGKLFVGQTTVRSDSRAVITSNDSSEIGLVVKGASSQGVALQSWVNSSNLALSWVDEDGKLHLPGGSESAPGLVVGSDPTTGVYGGSSVLYMTVEGDNHLMVGGGVMMLPKPIIPESTSDVPLRVLGLSGQATNLQEWYSVEGATPSELAGVRVDGRVFGSNPVEEDDFTTVAHLEAYVGSVVGAISASDVSFDAYGNLAATDVQAALEELDDEKAGLALANTFTTDQEIEQAGAAAWDVKVPGDTVGRVSVGHFFNIPLVAFSADGSSVSTIVAHSGGVLQVLNSTLSATENLRVAEPSNSADAATKNYVDTTVGDYVQIVGDTMTGPLDIEGSADVVQLAVRGDAGQSSDIQQWSIDGATETIFAGVRSDGRVYGGEPTADDDFTTKGFTDEFYIPKPSIITQSGTARTFALSDAWDYIRCTSSSATTITIPAESSVNFDVGTQIHVIQAGTGTVTIQGDGGVTANAAGDLSAQWSAVTCIKIGSDEWDVIGGLA